MRWIPTIAWENISGRCRRLWVTTLKGRFRCPRYTRDEELEQIPYFLRNTISQERWLWRWDTPEKYDSNMRDYLRLITGIDLTVKRILEALDARGQLENTIILYSADNGFMMGNRKMAGKWNHYEESLRVPLIVWDPRVEIEKRGRVSPKLALNIDLAPTLLEYGGVPVPGHYDGRSLKALIDHPEAPADWRTAFYAEHGMIRSNIPRWNGVRSERFKYALYPDFGENGEELLYDLVADPAELRNLAQDPDYAEDLTKMRNLHQEFQRAIPDADNLRSESIPMSVKTETSANPVRHEQRGFSGTSQSTKQ
jgi:choline-sulfatase